MTNKEINEYLAINDGWEKVIKPSRYCFVRGKEERKEAPDYCSNAMPVLENLLEDKRVLAVEQAKISLFPNYKVTVYHNVHTDKNCSKTAIIEEYGNVLGEAICRAAVEYDKAKRGGE